MRHFDIRYTNTDVTVEEDKSAVRKGLDGPGKCLGYRAMHSKIRQEYPKRMGRWYLDYLHEERTITSHIRIDRGSETGIMAKMHSYLRQSNGDMNPFDTVIYGPSTSNQVKIRKIKFHRKYETCTGSFFFQQTDRTVVEGIP